MGVRACSFFESRGCSRKGGDKERKDLGFLEGSKLGSMEGGLAGGGCSWLGVGGVLRMIRWEGTPRLEEADDVGMGRPSWVPFS